MKKKLVCLAVLLLAMVLMPKKAMAEQIVHKFCQNCNQPMECTITGKIVLNTDHTKHEYPCRCRSCKNTFTVIERHYDDDATCTNQGFCAFCGNSYIDSSAHKWGKWVDNGDGTHSQVCEYNGEHKSTPASHTESKSATCTTAAFCNVCNSSYGSTNPVNHTGTPTTTYEKISDTQHRAKTTYSCCAAVDNGTPASHTESKSATCTAAAYCNVCNSSYGEKNPDNHTSFKTTYEKISDDTHKVTVTCEGCGKKSSENTEGHNWSKWKKANEHYHIRYCNSDGCHTQLTVSHASDPQATCVTSQICSTCQASYLDTDNHEGTIHTTYVICSENEFEHVVTKTCDACKQTVDTWIESHQVDTNTTCTQGAHCALCSSYYGKPLGHDMGRWKPTEDGKQHYRTCSRDCGEIEFGGHDVTQQATCDSEAYCRICGPFGEFDNTAHNWDAWQYYNDDQHYRCCLYRNSHKEYADHIEGTAATCDTPAKCAVCNQFYGQTLGHELVKHDAKAPTCTEIGWDAYETCSHCDYTTYVEKPALGHDIVTHDGKVPTCTEIGWDAYETCSHCDYTTYVEKPALGHSYTTEFTKPTCNAPGSTIRTCQRCKQSTTEQTGSTLSHWYGEWKPEGHGTNGTHTASCLRWCGHQLSIPCTLIPYTRVLTDGQTEKLELCPVCGQVSDGTRLELVKEAKAAALTRELPAGEVVVRVGVLENGQTLMSVAFEISGRLTQPTGQVKITLPAALLDGNSLCLLDEDGGEAALEFDMQEEEVSFVLDFTPNQLDEEKEPSPTALIRLVPAE